MYDDTFPVLIVGGGPVGLSASLLLSCFGVPTLLIERHASTSIHPRARGLNIRTMEIYRELGLEEAVHAAGAALADSRYMLFVETLAGKEIRRVPDEDLFPVGEQLAQVTPCSWCQCAQDELEPILLAAARRNGADVQFGTELVTFTQDSTGVTATVMDRSTGVQRTVRARYMLAADGANSTIRKALEVPMFGQGTLEHYVNIYFHADLRNLVHGREFGICFVENSAVEGIFLAVNNTDRWLFNVPYAPEQGGAPADFTPERCTDLVRKAVGLPQIDVEILSVLPWVATARVADRLQVGQVFLAGDAAHLMPPAGGFGLNTGVQDAHNLAWKLAAVLNENAEPALLETYNTERQPVARLVVEQALRELDAPTPDTVVGSGPADGPPEHEGDELMDQLTAVLGYRYTSRAILAPDSAPPVPYGLDLTGRPGTRAPHLWIEREGKRISTLDLFNRHFVLLVGSNGQVWSNAARAVATLKKIDLAIYRFGRDGDLIDLDERWCATYGVTSEGAVLVRPDGFVAWRSKGLEESPQVTLEQILDRLLCSPRSR